MPTREQLCRQWEVDFAFGFGPHISHGLDCNPERRLVEAHERHMAMKHAIERNQRDMPVKQVIKKKNYHRKTKKNKQ